MGRPYEGLKINKNKKLKKINEKNNNVIRLLLLLTNCLNITTNNIDKDIRASALFNSERERERRGRSGHKINNLNW